MHVAVAGGSGVVGRHVVRALERHGHEVVILARSRGVDLTTGRGLLSALAEVDSVIDVSNVATLRRRTAVDFFSTATRQLLEAEAQGGVTHHVVLSIVGVDRVDTGYYAGKLRQEELVESGPVPWTVLRATQFHEFAGQLLDRSRGPLALVPQMRVQPVAAAEVGARLAELATGPARGRAHELAGPDVHELVDLARRESKSGRRSRRVVGVRVPGSAGRAMSTGALLPTGPVNLGTVSFDDWLSSAR